MDLRDVLSAVRRGWWWLIGCLLLGLAAAAVLVWSAPPLYASSTDLYVSAVDRPDAEGARDGDLYAQERSSSYAGALRTRQLVGRAIEELGLDLDPGAVARSVTVEAVPGTAVVAVTVTDRSPARARDLAGALGRQFTAWVGEVEDRDGDVGPKTSVTTVQPAELPTRAVSPDPALSLGLGGSLGFLAGLGLTVLRYRSTATVRTEDDVRRFTGATLAGTIPGGADEGAAAPAGWSKEQGLRGLVANLSVLDGAGPPRVVVVTGVVPDDGAGALAHDLADALAAAGRRVVLLDADIRRTERGAGAAGGAGFADVLAGTARLAEAVSHRRGGLLTVVPAGLVPADPAQLLGSPRLGSVLHALRTTQDHVIVTAPPLESSSDAAVLGSLADGCLLAVRYGGTRADRVAGAAGTLARSGVDLLGVVLTHVPRAATVTRSSSYRYEADEQRGPAVGERRAVVRSTGASVAGRGGSRV